MKITEYLKNNILYLDGGMGTLLQAKGLGAGELPEKWNISHPEVIIDIHRNYFDAGSNVVNTNTFGANSLKYSDAELEDIVSAAINNAREAALTSCGSQPKWIALDIGPTGRMLKPYGDLDFEDAVDIFAKVVKLGERYGADLVFIETMSDSYETKAALLAAKENCSLPVFVSNAFGADGKLMTGADPAAMVALLEGMGADAIGVNCSLGPKALADVVKKYLTYSSIPVILKPNAGLPRVTDGNTVYDVSPIEFAHEVEALVREGVMIVGGCCGTTPDHIRETVNATQNIAPVSIEKKNITCVSSYTHAVTFGKAPILIGERINPTGKKRFKEALRSNDINYILGEGIAEQEKGVHILDVNVGLPEIDEKKMLENVICELQAIIDLPLQIDTSDVVAMEAALRRYNGKPMINSVNGKAETMNAIFPLVKKYGGLVVALTLDENGIPDKAEERVAIAENILKVAESYGIEKKDIIFDPLTLTVSADPVAAVQTLRAVSVIRNDLGAHTSLGVSNVSFGLPNRDALNGTFFALALANGLSAAIMNPFSNEMMKTYHSYLALAGLDAGFEEYISFSSNEQNLVSTAQVTTGTAPAVEIEYSSELQKAVVKGLGSLAASLTQELIKTKPPLEVVQDEIIPALDIVGKGFEEKRIYLPQLLMSAEAAKAAFEVVKNNSSGSASQNRGRVVIATVKGDIHDIGKNIVKLLLENYGFNVYDMGRDVSPEDIANKVIELDARLLGLSALMTTTVPAMEETIRLVHEKKPDCKIVVGGAVLTQSYADAIGADKYAPDAMETVRYAELLENIL